MICIYGPGLQPGFVRRGLNVLREEYPRWLGLLPAVLRDKIKDRPNLQKALNNTGWLFADRILRMGVGLLVVIWVARYLGPEQFGLLNYAMAFVAFFGVIATLGLNGIVVRDLLKEPDAADSTMGTAFLLQIAGGFLACGLAILAISMARPDDYLARLIVAILGFTVVFKASEVVKYWFESQVQSKYTVWAENGVFMLAAAIRLVLINTEAPLVFFAWAAFAEGLLTALALLGVYALRGGKIASWHCHYQRAKTLFRNSWPLVLSGLAVMVYMRIDQIMLGQMLGDDAVGIYSAAVRISEVWYFIPIAIVASLFPSIIDAKKRSEVLYSQRMQNLYDLMSLLAFAVAVPMTFMSGNIVVFLFGEKFVQAGPVLAIHIWAGVFVFLGVASSNWLILGGYQKNILYRTSLGALVNILANWLLIPALGIAGAAVATVFSYFIAVFSVFIHKETRMAGIMMSKSLLLHKSIRRVQGV